MLSGWTAASSQRCKAKWKYLVVSQQRRQRSLWAGGTSVKSRETDRENGYKNRVPVFSYKRSPNIISIISYGGVGIMLFSVTLSIGMNSELAMLNSDSFKTKHQVTITDVR